VGTRCLGVAIEKIRLAPAFERPAFVVRELDDRIVGPGFGRRQDDFIEERSPSDPAHHAGEERLTEERKEDLARETSAAHARLDDRDDAPDGITSSSRRLGQLPEPILPPVRVRHDAPSVEDRFGYPSLR
jgi:hypothetical protein